ncbi:MAG TPA: hypothetical protein VLQ90_01175, partial [Pyrinomonadaceae bacterium]|nr:hypothetical protein [Pyrinomonadaceae bacterium]
FRRVNARSRDWRSTTRRPRRRILCHYVFGFHNGLVRMRTALAHWSPDGQQIAFSGAVPGKPWQILLISRDGGSPQSVAAEEVLETDPTWSPDGGTHAFGHQDLAAQAEHTFIELFDFKSRHLSRLPGSQTFFGPR